MNKKIWTYKEYLNNWRHRKEYLLDKYSNVKFSEDFHKNKNNEVIKDYNDLTKINMLSKIEAFIHFYEKYKPVGIRIIDGEDVYLEAKEIYDTIVSGEIHIDKALNSPDNTLRDIIMLMHLDEYEANKRLSRK